MNTGIELKPLVLRATAVSNGRSIVLRRATLEMAPVIEEGKTHGDSFARYKEPDRFLHFELELRVPWYRAFSLRRVLHKDVELEFWTENTDGEQQFVQWALPYSDWKRIGFSRMRGQTREGPGVHYAGIPDGQPVTAGAWWKTDTPPPVAARR